MAVDISNLPNINTIRYSIFIRRNGSHTLEIMRTDIYDVHQKKNSFLLETDALLFLNKIAPKFTTKELLFVILPVYTIK